ncbi:MAG: hypothetical protein QMC81_10995 [Thermoanaerobacterales bacterium]|nr:hypothetical protein [Thermoanaerobacterales bacterium]
MSLAIWVYRLFDVADEIDLEAAERLLAVGSHVSRLRLTRVSPKAIVFKNPPVMVEMGCREISLAGLTLGAEVRARVYDLGVVAVILRLAVPPQTSFAELTDLALAVDGLREETFKTSLDAALAALRPAMVGPHPPEFSEDLVVYYFREWEEEWDPVPLLLAEKQPVSPETRKETLAHRFSYADDFAFLTWDTAIVYDPTGSPDIPDLLELANAQLLELRYYDQILDREIERMYDAIEDADRGASYRRLGRYRHIRRQLLELVADITAITGRIQNSLRVTEDVFYARVYTGYLRLLRVRDWTESIRQKVEVIQRSYTMLSDEVVTSRAELLEILIIALIAFEIVLSLVRA